VIIVFVQKDEKKNEKQTLVTRILETTGAIYFNFGM